MPSVEDILKITLPASAYFYRLKEEPEIDLVEWDSFWNRICGFIRKKISNPRDNFRQTEWQEYHMPNGEVVHYGICVFRLSESKPTFAKEIPNFWCERKTGYVMLIEYKRHIALLKKNSPTIKPLMEIVMPIDYKHITALHDNAIYTKISMRNLQGTEHALQTKSYEASDLQISMPYVGSSHYAIRALRGKKKSGTMFGVVPSTSRVGEAESFKWEKCIDWTTAIIEQILQPVHQNDFISLFGEALEYSSVEGDLVPTSIMLQVGRINDLLLEPNVILKYKNTNTIVTKDALGVYYNMVAEKILLINQATGTTVEHHIIVSKTPDHIYLSNRYWQIILIESDSFNGTLEEYINQECLFSVYFEQADYIYSNNTLFKDHNLLNSCERLLSVLKKIDTLGYTNTEKTKKENFQHLPDWDEKSIFHLVETHFKNHKYIICDDYDTEWADHIGISNNVVTFYIEKHKPLTKYVENGKTKHRYRKSASYFQEVVGQALKNLGNFTPMESSWLPKKDLWRGLHTTSDIKRLRKGKNIDDAIKMWKENINSPLYKKEMCIVINFLSISEFKKNLKAIKDNQNISDTDKTITYQRLWILSSFVNTCLESGVTPIVYCAP